ncbi:MAG: aminotransferase class I/II-fold pyridoxal phosphate-dependent enzyme [Gemmatimonadetes bacterium]|nr:aminotransferase class I/II-fold pyridoxal phosphate-dependent enzyme [Gemmatimonadota bacterium]
MPFRIFELERWQSDFEHAVEFNLADSSVKGAPLAEVLPPDEIDRFLTIELGYPMVNGTEVLRQRIASLYPGAAPANVLVTVGGAEANQIACQTLLGPGDRVALMEPGYRQVYGLAEAQEATVDPFRLDPGNGWRPDLDQLAAIVGPGTKMIALVNPNNPTGMILTPEERHRIVAIAARVGAWILADEVYRGGERYSDDETPSFWGEYDRVIAVNSLSKAYGLSGLRIGWLVAPSSVYDDIWRRHEYTVISAAAPSMRLAELALSPAIRPKLIARQRALSRAGWELMDRWLSENFDLVSVAASEATSMAFVRYHLPIDSVRLADEIRRRSSVLVAPGVYLGAEDHLRITHGVGRSIVEPALDRIGSVLRELRTRRPVAHT